jgi:hypothetical protein
VVRRTVSGMDVWATNKLHANGIGLTYTFDADLTANTLRMQIHRPLNDTFPDADKYPTPSPVITLVLSKDKPLADMRPVICLYGPNNIFTDAEPSAVFPRKTHDGPE